jgi:GNAT superfamily N-acetyltransferase
MMVFNSFDQGEIELQSGARLRIRALWRGELGPVRELCARLSPRTRYFRFLAPINVVSDALLYTLAEVDDSRRLALVVESRNEGGRDVVALGNVSGRDDNVAEIGLVVADSWQRQGIGVALATALLQAAEARGYDRFVVHGCWHNPALRPLLNHVAEIESATTRSGVSEITFVRRRPAPAFTRALRGLLTLEHGPKSDMDVARDWRQSRQEKAPVNDPLEQAYLRILAAKGRVQ